MRKVIVTHSDLNKSEEWFGNITALDYSSLKKVVRLE